MTTEPDPAERAALGAALAEPEPPPTKPSLYELWQRAGGNTGGFDRTRFLDLLHEHGHTMTPRKETS